jgi:hypothetical protein
VVELHARGFIISTSEVGCQVDRQVPVIVLCRMRSVSVSSQGNQDKRMHPALMAHL